MASKIEYLKLALKAVKPMEHKSWYVKAFTIPDLVTAATEDLSEPELVDATRDVVQQHVPELIQAKEEDIPYDLVVTPEGLKYKLIAEDGSLSLEYIDDYRPGEPLFHFRDEVEVDNTWLPHIPGKIVTNIGRLIVNGIVLYPVVKGQIPYLNRPILPQDIEKEFVSKVRNDDELTPDHISVKEMIACQDRLAFLETLSTFTNVGATLKSITPPPGIVKYKQQLIAEYGEKLKDPVYQVEFENKLRAYDAEYLSDDPAAKFLFDGKARTGRAKMFLAMGSPMDLLGGSTDGQYPIIDSLSDGIPPHPEDFARLMNDVRSGTYARGSSTALSGYAYKILQRALSGIAVVKEPCDTKVGFPRPITEKNAMKFIGRYLLDGKWKLMSSLNDVAPYVGKTMQVRSVYFCKTPGNAVCWACMSESYKDSESGITNLAANISSVLMTQFLKLNHGVIKELTHIDVNDLFT